MTESGIYVYAITRDTGGGVPEGLRGVVGGAVQQIRQGGLVAHVSVVPLSQFGEEPLTRLLEELDWVEGVARAHDRVVEALADRGPTAPVRLVTVYRGEDQVRDLLDRRCGDLLDVLSRVAERREWGVKAYVTRPEPPSPATASAEPSTGASTEPSTEPPGERPAGPPDDDRTAGSPGTAYLQRRKASLRNRQDMWRAAVEQAERLHAALSRIAVDSRRHRSQDPRLSGRNDVMILNGAYLLDPGSEREFADALSAFRGEGMDIELTGPWAPYSFISLELSAEPEAHRDD